MNIVKNLVDPSKYNTKCPYQMTATRIVVHETANDASAQNEIAYMKRNNNQVSYHFAVDDKEAVQGIPLDRNAWHAGDGNGKGNREGIAIEICYSKSGGERWRKAVDNGAKLVAQLLQERGWGIDKVTKHQDYSGKNCPHRILAELGWNNFINKVNNYLHALKEQEAADMVKQHDNTPDAYAKEAITWAVNNGILRGTAEGDYMLHTAVTRQDVLVFLHRAFNKFK
jgi:N-acetylmuramoyl-L-alanine amidase CwlA